MGQNRPKSSKIIFFVLNSQTRSLFHMFQSLEYEFVGKGWNFWSRGSKSGNFGPKLDQNWANFRPNWPKSYPKEPSKATFFISESLEYELVIKFETLDEEGQKQLILVKICLKLDQIGQNHILCPRKSKRAIFQRYWNFYYAFYLRSWKFWSRESNSQFLAIIWTRIAKKIFLTWWGTLFLLFKSNEYEYFKHFPNVWFRRSKSLESSFTIGPHLDQNSHNHLFMLQDQKMASWAQPS